MRTTRLEEGMTQLTMERMEIEKMETKIEKEIFERVEEALVEVKCSMKKMMVLVCFGCVIIVGCGKLLG